MWSETVGLKTRPVWDQKNRSWSCTLWSWSWSCRSDVTVLSRSIVIIILKEPATFTSTIYSFSILCLEHHYCGDQQWRSLKLSAFVYFPWSWSWSCYFGLDVGLKNLVLLTWTAHLLTRISCWDERCTYNTKKALPLSFWFFVTRCGWVATDGHTFISTHHGQLFIYCRWL